jgi:hypothetical protein
LYIFGSLCILGSFLIFIIYLYQLRLLSESERKLLNSNDFLTIMSIFLFFLVIGVLTLFLDNYLKTIKQKKKIPRLVRISKVKTTRYYIKLARKIALENSKIILDEAKDIINLTLKECESRNSYFSKFIPILSTIYVIFILYSFGLSIQVMEQKANWNNLIPVSMFTLITLILQWLFDWKIQSDILKYKKFLFIVEKAQLIAEEIETNKYDSIS